MATGLAAAWTIVRLLGVLLAGNTLVVVGYGWAGQGIAERARGAGALGAIVCEVDPPRALGTHGGLRGRRRCCRRPSGTVFVDRDRLASVARLSTSR